MTRFRSSSRSRRVTLVGTAGLLFACGSSSVARHATDAGHARDATPVSDGSVGACTTTAGASGTLLRGTLLLPTGPTQGELLISASGTIACAAASCAASAGYSAATLIECPSAVISPGLINPHDHTEYATVGPEPHGTIRYEYRNDWDRGADGATPLPSVVNAAYLDAGTAQIDAVIAAQELRLVLGGGTSVIGSGGVNGLARNLAAYGSGTGSDEGLTGDTVYFDTYPLDNDSATVVTSGCVYPATVAPSSAFAYGRFVPHIAEGINTAAENELLCLMQASNDVVTSQTSVIHGVGMNGKDVSALKASGAVLVWSPRSNLSLYGNTAPISELSYAGVTVALGTDWLASGSMNMLRELACADSLNKTYFGGVWTDQQLFEMATVNGAIAAGFQTQIGSLAPGMQADIAVFDGTTHAGYRALIDASSEDVRLVLRGGKVLYGEANVVGALGGASCAPLSVCGISRSVCIDSPGVTLSDVEAIGASVYEIFPCRTAPPPEEPTCVPYRDTYPNGITGSDQDGDGVDDSSDDCPTIFNPIRPMDGAKQADVDGDGFGDACDTAPLDPTKH